MPWRSGRRSRILPTRPVGSSSITSPADCWGHRHLREVLIEQGQTLEHPGQTVDRVYFPQSGLISLIVAMAEDAALEVSVVGHEGAIGMAAGLVSRISFIRAL